MTTAILNALIVVTSHSELGITQKPTGYYLHEVTHAYYPLIEAGYKVDFASPKGGKAPLDMKSYDLSDSANKKFVDENRLEALDKTIALKNIDPKQYHIIFFAGGHGTMWDFPNDPNINRIVAEIYERGGIVAAVCHGPAALVNVKLSTGKYLVDGKKVSAFTNAEEAQAELIEVMPFLLQTTLISRGAQFQEGKPWTNTVSVDDRLITGQNPQSAKSVAESIVEIAKDRIQ